MNDWLNKTHTTNMNNVTNLQAQWYSGLTVQRLADFHPRQLVSNIGAIWWGGRLPQDGDPRLGDGCRSWAGLAGRDAGVSGITCGRTLGTASAWNTVMSHNFILAVYSFSIPLSYITVSRLLCVLLIVYSKFENRLRNWLVYTCRPLILHWDTADLSFTYLTCRYIRPVIQLSCTQIRSTCHIWTP